MKRFVSLLLAVVLTLSVIPAFVRASEIDDGEMMLVSEDVIMDCEDLILDYGVFDEDAEMQSVALMGVASEETYALADIPAGKNYKSMSASQEIIDLIKDFEGFRSKAYRDNSQWTVGYGTRASGPDVTVTREEAEQLLREVIESTYAPAVNNFCKKNGKQPTQQQFDAMLDLTYNVGSSWTTGSAVPDVVLNPVTALEVVKGFGAWNRSGGSASYVHANRRIREALIYLYGEYYLAYGGQDCKTGLEVVSNDDLPHFKTMIFKTKSGKLDSGRTDYAAYYPVGDYYRSFPGATRSGYTLIGWEITKRSNKSVNDGEMLSIWDTVEENLELTAVWEKGVFEVAPEEPPVDAEEPTEPEVEDQDELPFVDVPESTWYTDAVDFVYREGLMNGTSSTTFEPHTIMTRGMLVTVLYRMDGSKPVTAEERACFDDIAGAYYTDAVAWARSAGIVNGVSDTKFEPNRPVSRQDAVTIFYRYYAHKNGSVEVNTAVLDDFVDRNAVAGYAVNAFAWSVSNNVIKGVGTAGGDLLCPEDGLDRAQAAVVLQRYVN